MWLNAIAALVLAGCIAAGAWNGALKTGLRIATLVLAYAAAALLGPAFAPAFGAQLGIGELLASLVSGTAVFVVAYFALGIAARFARRLGPTENVGRTPRDRFLGGCFGALRGALIAIMVVYLAMWLDALRATGKWAVVPEIGESVAADITGGLMRTAIESAVDTADPASRFASRLASRPAAAAADLQGMLDDPNFARLRADARFWSDVEDGNVEAALRRSSFAALADDAQLRQKAADLGLAPDQAATDADLFRDSMALVFREIAPRLRGLRSDPAVKELLADPAVVAMLENGDTIGLLAHPKFRELVGRLSAPAQR